MGHYLHHTTRPPSQARGHTHPHTRPHTLLHLLPPPRPPPLPTAAAVNPSCIRQSLAHSSSPLTSSHPPLPFPTLSLRTSGKQSKGRTNCTITLYALHSPRPLLLLLLLTQLLEFPSSPSLSLIHTLSVSLTHTQTHTDTHTHIVPLIHPHLPRTRSGEWENEGEKQSTRTFG